MDDKNFYLVIAEFKNGSIYHFLTANKYADNVHAKAMLNEDIKSYDLFPLRLTDEFCIENSSFALDDICF